MRQRRVVVVDDDFFLRTGAALVLRQRQGIAEPSTHTLHAAQAFGPAYWGRFDVAVVDVLDQREERDRIGTDIYTGVVVIETIRRANRRATIVAITPTRANPLLMERLIRSGADYVIERVDISTMADLVGVVVDPDQRYRPVRHPRRVLLEEGLGLGADPNRAVDIFKASPLYGRVRPGLTQAAIGPRRAAITLRDRVAATGFVGTGQRPRWNEVRDYLLKLTGRLPVTERRLSRVDA